MTTSAIEWLETIASTPSIRVRVGSAAVALDESFTSPTAYAVASFSFSHPVSSQKSSLCVIKGRFWRFYLRLTGGCADYLSFFSYAKKVVLR